MKLSSLLSKDLRSCLVKSADGTSTSIDTLIKDHVSVLLFVRHFGCIGCSENVGLLTPLFKEIDRLGAKTLIIGCGPHIFIESFKERYGLLFSPVDIYSDASLTTHQAAGLQYSIWGGFSPKGLYEMGRAFVNGHTSGEIQGDIKQQAGAIVVDSQGIVRLYHRNQTLGDHVNSQDIMDRVLASVIDSNPEL